jgi:hypothetical protein
VHFAAGEDVEVVHRYGMDAGNSVTNGTDVRYVTRTGAMWNGPIGHARFTFRFRPGTLLLGATDEPPIVSSTRTPRSVDVVFEAKDWNPKGDINVDYAGPSDWLDWSPMPEWTAPSAFDWKKGAKRAGLPDTASCEALDQMMGERPLGENAADELGKSGADLRVCKNAIFARRGRIFSDPLLNLYFYGAKAPQAGSRRHFVWQPNPDFKESDLTDREWKVLKAIERAAQLAKEPVVEPGPSSSALPAAPVPSLLAARPEGQGQTQHETSPKAAEQGCGCDLAAAPVGTSQLVALCGALGVLRLRRGRRL